MESTYQLSEFELKQLLNWIWEQYGYDFRQYAAKHVERRLNNRIRLSKISSAQAFKQQLADQPGFIRQLIEDLSINVTEMFRDPPFFEIIKKSVIPLLDTWPYIKLWHAGCSTGEEVYSMAILLKESGLYERTQIYATDFNNRAVQEGRNGIYPIDKIKKYAKNYYASGGMGNFSDYYHAKYDSVIMDPELKRNIVWSRHNLTVDSDFTETEMIMCRNVLIYFDRDLQNRAYNIFKRSLVNGGFLCLGSKETIKHTAFSDQFEAFQEKHSIYRKSYNLLSDKNYGIT